MAVSRRLRFEILRRDDNTCRYCGRRPPEVKLTIDHVVPEALGGSDDPTNLVAACEDCNGGKTSIAPDSSTVAQVADDAERWAAAMKAAADELLANHGAQERAYGEFDAKWSSWSLQKGAEREDVPRPVNWRQTVDALIASGLPLPILLDAVDRAMASKKLRPENIFRYMCGIAWRRVHDIQRSARAMVGAVPTSSADQPSRHYTSDGAALAREVLAAIADDAEEIQRYIEQGGLRAAEAVKPEDDELAGADPLVFAVLEAVYDCVGDRWHLRRELGELLAQLPPDLVSKAQGEARSNLRQVDAEETVINVMAETARLASVQIARRYLDELPEDERAEWLAAGTAHIGGNPPRHDSQRRAAQYARAYKVMGLHLAGMCYGPGRHGAKCPRRATYTAWLDDCPACADKCEGHHVFCDEHIEAAVDGTVTSTVTGKPLVVRDFAETGPPNDWAPTE